MLDLKKRRIYNNKYRHKIRKEVYELLGNKCVVCNRVSHLVLHEIHGKKHPYDFTAGIVRKKPEDFRLLCKGRCHTGVHFCMEHLGMAWKDIIKELTEG